MIKRESGGDIKKALQQRGMTLEDLKKKIKIEQAFINVATKDVKIPDSIIKGAYEQGLKAPNSPLTTPEAIRVSLIMCKTKDKIDKAKKLLDSGTDFGSVAMQMTDEPKGKETQGVLGYVTRDNQIVPKPVRDTAFALPIGKYSQPMLVQKTWLIIKADQRRKARTRTYDEVKDVIREQIAVQQGLSKGTYRKAMSDFTKSSDIQINAERYKGLVDKLKKQAAQTPPVPSAQGTAAPTKEKK